MRHLIDHGIRELHRPRVPEIRDAEKLVRLSDANQAIPPKRAIRNVVLKAFFS